MFLAGWGLSAIAQDTQVFPCVADTWIRESAGSNKYGTADAIELGIDGEQVRGGLIAFEFAIPEGMKIQNATMTLYTKRCYNNPEVGVYGYSNNFTEGDACWNVEKDYYNSAIAAGPITSFVAAGQSGKYSYDASGFNDDYKTLDKWTNTIDVTNYVKAQAVVTNRVNFLLTNTQNVRFYSNNQPEDGTENMFGGAETHLKKDLVPVLTLTFVEDADSNKDIILPVADTQIRLGNTTNNAAATAIEIKSTSSGDRFYGLMRFELPAELLNTDKYEIESVSLRIVTTQNKGDRNMQIFDYDNNFAENTVYANESDYVDAALAKEPIAEYSANGYGTFAMGDNKSGWTNSDYTKVENWTNNIDLTSYVIEKTNAQSSSFNILIMKKNLHNDAMKIATKEATDITNDATEIADQDAFTFKAEDLWPQLTIVYNKKEVVEPEKPEIFYGSDETSQSEGEDKGNYDIWVDSQNDEVIIYFKAPEDSEVFYSYTKKALDSNAGTLMGVNVRKAAPAEGQETKANLSSWENGYHELILPNNTAGTLSVRVVSPDADEQNYTYSYMAAKNDPTAVEEIEAAQAVAEYFTLQGVRVLNPERGQIYIKVVAGKASKIVF